MLSSFLFTSILSHESFGEALAFVLSNRIADETLLPTQLFSLFMTLEKQHPEVLQGAIQDLEAVYQRVRLPEQPKMLMLSCVPSNLTCVHCEPQICRIPLARATLRLSCTLRATTPSNCIASPMRCGPVAGMSWRSCSRAASLKCLL